MVVQVLFFEQLQLLKAIAGTLIAVVGTERPFPILRREDGGVIEVEAAAGGEGRGGMWRRAVRDNHVLRLHMDSMRTHVHELERERSTMKKAIEKIDKLDQPGGGSWRSSLTKKFGCKFKTQMCDSLEPTTKIVEARKGRSHRHQLENFCNILLIFHH